MSKEYDILFQLIHSLGKAEKRHFKLFAARHKDGERNNTIKLFDRLEKLKKYDEKEFLRKHSKEGFVKHFAFNKHFLYKQILKALHAYHASSNSEETIREQIHYIEILIFKGLHKQAYRMVTKTKHLAEDLEHFGLLAEVLKKERELLRELGYNEISSKGIQAHKKENVTAFKKQEALLEYESLAASTLVEMRTQGFVRTKERQVRMSRSIQKELKLISTKHPDFIRGQMQRLNIEMGRNFFTQNDLKALKSASQLSTLMELNPQFIKDATRSYINALHNQIVINNKLMRYDAIPGLVNKLNSLKVTSRNLKNRIFYASHNLILSMYASNGKFEEGLELLKVMKRKLDSGEVQFLNKQNEMTHEFSVACIYFGSGDHVNANKYLNKIIDHSHTTARGDLVVFALIMRMLIQFEVGKADLLEYSVRSVHRYLEKRHRIYKFEDVMLHFIKTRTPLMNSKQEIVNGYKQLYKELLPLSKNEFEKNVFEYFDLIAWLKSKVEGKDLAEVMREKYKW